MTVPDTSIDPDALKYILSMPKGRAVIWDMLAAFGLFRSAHDAKKSEREFKLGMHNAALLVYHDCMAVSPDLTALMFREQGDYDNDAGKPEPAARKPHADDSDGSGPGLGLGRLGPATDLAGD